MSSFEKLKPAAVVPPVTAPLGSLGRVTLGSRRPAPASVFRDFGGGVRALGPEAPATAEARRGPTTVDEAAAGRRAAYADGVAAGDGRRQDRARRRRRGLREGARRAEALSRRLARALSGRAPGAGARHRAQGRAARARRASRALARHDPRGRPPCARPREDPHPRRARCCIASCSSTSRPSGRCSTT